MKKIILAITIIFSLLAIQHIVSKRQTHIYEALRADHVRSLHDAMKEKSMADYIDREYDTVQVIGEGENCSESCIYPVSGCLDILPLLELDNTAIDKEHGNAENTGYFINISKNDRITVGSCYSKDIFLNINN